jgi:hypothetical protein
MDLFQTIFGNALHMIFGIYFRLKLTTKLQVKMKKTYRFKKMPQLSLLASQESYVDQKIVIVAHLCGIQLPVRYGVSEEEIRRHCVAASGLLLKTEDGYIWQSSSILRYFGRCFPCAYLMGNSNFEESLVNQWLEATWNDVGKQFLDVRQIFV